LLSGDISAAQRPLYLKHGCQIMAEQLELRVALLWEPTFEDNVLLRTITRDGQKHLQLIKILAVNEDRARNLADRAEAVPLVEFNRAHIASFDHQHYLLDVLGGIGEKSFHQLIGQSAAPIIFSDLHRS
jgi:hypothetical protein